MGKLNSEKHVLNVVGYTYEYRQYKYTHMPLLRTLTHLKAIIIDS